MMMIGCAGVSDGTPIMTGDDRAAPGGNVSAKRLKSFDSSDKIFI